MRLVSLWAPAALVCASFLVGCSFDESGLGPHTDGGLFPDSAIDAPRADADLGIDASDVDASGIDASDIDASPIDASPDAPIDAAPDAPPDAMPDAGCPGDVLTVPFDNFTGCDVPAATSSIAIPAGSFSNLDIYVLDTDDQVIYDDNDNVAYALPDTNVVSQSGGPDILIISLDDFTLGAFAVIAVTGSRVPAIVTYGDMTIDGWLSVGADFETAGPGGGLAGPCGTGTGGNGGLQTDGDGDTGGAGGGGGGFGSTGGRGAAVPGSGNGQTARGMTNGNSNNTPLRGGCNGGSGGNGGGAGGGGAGALQLVVEGTLDIGGWISAQGGGGRGASAASAGGGGGGSGGALLFQANALTIASTGRVTAHGGGGGEGSLGGGQFGGEDGENGQTDSAQAAQGGSGGGFGGDGGNGGVANSGTDGSEGIDGSGNAPGGGGGGGGRGRIDFDVTGTTSVATGAVVSPSAQ